QALAVVGPARPGGAPGVRAVPRRAQLERRVGLLEVAGRPADGCAQGVFDEAVARQQLVGAPVRQVEHLLGVHPDVDAADGPIVAAGRQPVAHLRDATGLVHAGQTVVVSDHVRASKGQSVVRTRVLYTFLLI